MNQAVLFPSRSPSHQDVPSAAVSRRWLTASMMAAGLLGATWAQAQSTPQSAPQPASPASAPAREAAPQAGGSLEKVVVTGNPLRTEGLVRPATALAGDLLTELKALSLAETLSQVPGVSATWFGPQANRPTVRGQDGDRIRILQNSGGSVDASSLSYDHALPIDPLAIERLEVLRGPSALLYGGSALGGVINAIDNRVPSERVQGLQGRAEVRLGGANRERSAAAVLEGGQDAWAWHLDGFRRLTDNLSVPRFLAQTEDGPVWRNKVSNSAGQASGLALGASWVGQDGRIGFALDGYRNAYGSVVEDNVSLDMRRDQWRIEGEWRLGLPLFQDVNWQLMGSDYAHDELDGPQVGTQFRSRGQQGRVELRQRAVEGWSGVVGLQWEKSRFSALGEEAFVPSTRSQQWALFTMQQQEWKGLAGLPMTGQLGLRVEDHQVDKLSQGMEDKFGAPGSRSLQTRNLSLSLDQDLGAGWKASWQWAHTERAPTFYELYADGLHAATGAYERGSESLSREKGGHLEAGVQWKSGDWRFSAHAYESRVNGYIVLQHTAATVTVDGTDHDVYQYSPARARIRGLESELQWQWRDGGHRWTQDVKWELLRGVDRDAGTALPRLAPMRLLWTGGWEHGPWGARLGLEHVWRQDRISALDVPTPGYNLVNLNLHWRQRTAQGEWMVFAALNNLGNQLAYNASSVESMRFLAPLPGRSLRIGAQWGF